MKKQAKTARDPRAKHNSHQVMIFETQEGFIHTHALRCCECRKHVQWLSSKQAKHLELLGVPISPEKYRSPKSHLLNNTGGLICQNNYFIQ